tara:strand:+ start:101 stop:553 length:453 start_codon:yes stop_codon:yes gene_type:complete
MLDQLSNEPSPQGHEAAISITNTIKRLNNRKIRKILNMYNQSIQSKVKSTTEPFFTEALNLVIKEPPQFSLAAWYMGGENDYCIRVIDICYNKYVIRKLRLRKIRGILRSLALIKRIYDDTLERYYMPGGIFETNAALIWNPIIKDTFVK